MPRIKNKIIAITLIFMMVFCQTASAADPIASHAGLTNVNAPVGLKFMPGHYYGFHIDSAPSYNTYGNVFFQGDLFSQSSNTFYTSYGVFVTECWYYDTNGNLLQTCYTSESGGYQQLPLNSYYNGTDRVPFNSGTIIIYIPSYVTWIGRYVPFEQNCWISNTQTGTVPLTNSPGFTGYINEVSGPGETPTEPVNVWPYKLHVEFSIGKNNLPLLTHPYYIKNTFDLMTSSGEYPSEESALADGANVYLYSDSAYTTPFGYTFGGYSFINEVGIYDIFGGIVGYQSKYPDGMKPRAYFAFEDLPADKKVYWKFVPENTSLSTRYGVFNFSLSDDDLAATITYDSTDDDLTAGSNPSNVDPGTTTSEYTGTGITAVLIKLFKPTTITTEAVTNINESLQSHAPFSYVTESFEKLNLLYHGMNGSSPPSLVIPIMGQNHTFAITASWVSYIRPVTTFLIWSSLLVFGYKQYMSLVGGGGGDK